MLFQVTAIILLLVFYGCYIMAQLSRQKFDIFIMN